MKHKQYGPETRWALDHDEFLAALGIPVTEALISVRLRDDGGATITTLPKERIAAVHRRITGKQP